MELEANVRSYSCKKSTMLGYMWKHSYPIISNFPEIGNTIFINMLQALGSFLPKLTLRTPPRFLYLPEFIIHPASITISLVIINLYPPTNVTRVL